jgi:hypothetical protein
MPKSIFSLITSPVYGPLMVCDNILFTNTILDAVSEAGSASIVRCKWGKDLTQLGMLEGINLNQQAKPLEIMSF